MKLKIFGAAAAMIVMAGCGGGGGGGSSTINGNLIDAPVAGVQFVSGDIKGTTDNNGAYKCIKESTVIFSVAGVELGTVKCDSLTTPLTLAKNDPEVATNIAYFLQNLDDDHNPNNGIHIKIQNDIDGQKKIDFKNGAEVDALLNQLGIDVTIDPQTAEKNMQESIKNWKEGHQVSNESNKGEPFKFTTDYLKGKTLYFVQYDDFGYGDEYLKWNMAKVHFTDKTVSITEINTPDTSPYEASYRIDANGNLIVDYGEEEGEDVYSNPRKYEDYIKICEDGDCDTYLFFDETKAKQFVTEHNSQLQNNHNNTGNGIVEISKDQLLNKKIYFNNDQSFIEIKPFGNGLSCNLLDRHESSDGHFQDCVYENKHLIIWKGKDYQYSIAFYGDVNAGTKIEISEKNGKEIKTDQISKVEPLSA